MPLHFLKKKLILERGIFLRRCTVAASSQKSCSINRMFLFVSGPEKRGVNLVKERVVFDYITAVCCLIRITLCLVSEGMKRSYGSNIGSIDCSLFGVVMPSRRRTRSSE